MNDHELLRVLDFIDEIRTPFVEVAAIDDAAGWRIISYLVQSELRGYPVTITKLAIASELSRGTAIRRIQKLIDDGVIVRETKGALGKRARLHPSTDLMERVTNYARNTKQIIALTLGARGREESEGSYYFGSAPTGTAVIPPIKLLQSRLDEGVELQFLLNDDNYFAAMRNMWVDYRQNLASASNFHIVTQSELYREGLANGQRTVSSYDLIAVDMPWLGEFATKDLILPIGDAIRESGVNPLDFHPSIWSTTMWQGVEYGVPIYCTIEILACRSDIFDEASTAYPRTFDEVIAAGRRFHAPSKNRFGISWNAARGLPIASSFMFFMGCCGTSVLSIRKTPTGYSTENLDMNHMQALLDTDVALEVLDYMHRLLEITSPNATDMDWDDTCEEFLLGRSAMCYVWTMRAAQFESSIRSAVRNKVAYLPQPSGRGGKNISPIGGFLLCVPKNISRDRYDLAIEALTWMSSREAMKVHVQDGFPVAPRFSVSADPDARGRSKLVSFVGNLAHNNLLRNWQRPPVPFYTQMETILGEEVHNAMIGVKSDKQALRDAQSRLERVIRKT